jgi:hypothetical protein
MKRFVLGFLCALSLAIAPACGGDDDDDGGDTGDTSQVDASGGGGDIDASGGGQIDSGAGGDAEAFCTQYGEVCEFGGDPGYADQEACVAAFNGYTENQQACVIQHLGYAAEAGNPGDVETHCEHAAASGGQCEG